MVDQKPFPWGAVVLGTLLVIAIFSAVWLYLHPTVKTVTQTSYQQVPVEKIVEKVVKVPITVTKVMAYEKTAIAKTVDLPAEVVNSPTSQIVSDADVPPTEGGASVVTVLDTVTGDTTTLVKEKPLPFFEFKNQIGLGIYYGLSSQDGQKGELAGDWTFMRTGMVQWQLKSEVNTRPEATILGGIRIEFNP